MPLSPLEKIQYTQLINIAETNENLLEHLRQLNISDLEKLLSETKTDLDKLFIHIPHATFKRLLNHLPFSERDEKNIKISTFEWILNIIHCIASVGIPAAGLTLAIASSGWLLVATLGVVFFVTILSSLTNIYGLYMQNTKLLAKKRILNLQIEIKNELIRKKYLHLIQHILHKSVDEETAELKFQQFKNKLLSGLATPTQIFTELHQLVLTQSNRVKPKHIKTIIERMNASQLNVVFKKSDMPSENIFDFNTQNPPLTFKRWWWAHSGTAVANSITEKDDTSATIKILTLGNFVIVAAGLIGATAAISLLFGPYGIPIIISVAALCLTVIAVATIYCYYKNARRMHEFTLASEILEQQEFIEKEIGDLKKRFDKKILPELNQKNTQEQADIKPQMRRSTSCTFASQAAGFFNSSSLNLSLNIKNDKQKEKEKEKEKHLKENITFLSSSSPSSSS